MIFIILKNTILEKEMDHLLIIINLLCLMVVFQIEADAKFHHLNIPG